MASHGFAPAKSGFSRVFLVDGRARPDHQPIYESCMVSGPVEQGFGDIEKIECPSPDAYGQYDEVGQVQGGIERATHSLTGRYASDVASTLLAIARRRCTSDVQVHFGACTDPRLFNTFKKAIVIEDARIVSYSTDDLGALGSDDNSMVNETVDISASEFYEVLPLTFTERGADTVTNPVVDVVFCSSIACGDCQDEDAGCDIVYAVTRSSPGSPGTAPDLLYSTDSGVTVAADDITTLISTQDADAVACLGNYVLVISNDEAYLHYKLKSLVNAGTAGSWSQITTGFVGSNYPRDMWSTGGYAFIVGDNGYVYGTSDATAGVTNLDAGAATTENLTAVHAISDQFAVAVGENAAIVFTENRTNWQSVTGPTGVSDNFLCVWIKDENQWWIGTDAGEVYYTLDQGANWTEKAIPVTATAVYDLGFATDSVGYMAVVISGPAGRMLRTYDGGYSWVTMPESVGSTPANDRIEALAACVHDANLVVGVGLADDASDGFYVTAQD